MIVRALDIDNDWTFGAGLNNYLVNNAAVAQNIKTRLQSWLGDCFFDLGAGIDWLNFLGGSKNQLALNLAISAVILNTAFVIKMIQLSSNLDHVTRSFSVNYTVQSVYSLTAITDSILIPGAIIV